MKTYLFFAPLFLFVFGAIGVKLNSDQIQPASTNSVVDLSGKDLSEIPETYKEKILEAEILILDGNNLIQLPSWFKEAKNIKRISFNQNPNFDFFRFCVNFQEMTHIENISASGCNLKMIPYQLTFFTKLKSLDLSSNQINHIPYHFSFLTSLESCDLSANYISDVEMNFRDLQKLKSINISDNKDLNIKDFCSSFQYRELDYLKVDINDTIPETFSDIKAGKLDLGLDSETEFNNQLRLNSCSDLTIRSLSGSNLDKKLIDEIAGMKQIKNLSFSNFTISQWPSALKNINSLQELFISGTNLSSIENISSLPIKKLAVSNNNLTLAQIEKLKMEMPECFIFSDEEKLKGNGISFSVIPPVKNVTPTSEIKWIDPKKSDIFISKTGTTELKIPENAFVDEKGKLITTPVQISFTEYNDPVTVALSGIPMQIKNDDGATGDFSSAGMFKLEATSNGKEVFPNPKALITATIYSPQTTPYNLYNFQEGKGWSLMQNQPVVPANLTASSDVLLSGLNQQIDYTIYEELSRLKRAMGDTLLVQRTKVFEPKIAINYRKSPSKQNFTLSFNVLSMIADPRRDGNTFNFNCAEELKEMLKTLLLYNDYNYAHDSRLMDSIKMDIRSTYFPTLRDKRRNKRKKKEDYYWDENTILKDITITPDKSKDDYVLRFNYRGRIHKFHVILVEDGNTTSAIQKQNEKYIQNYTFASRKNEEGRSRLLNEYRLFYETQEKRVRENFEKNSKAFEIKKAQYTDQMKKNGLSFEEYENRKSKESQMAYSFQVAQFGISNCDIVQRFAKPGAVKVKFKDVLGKALIFFRMIRIDKVKNMITYLEPRDQLVIDYAHDQTALMFIIDDENIGLIDAETLSKNRDKNEVEVKIISTSELKPEKIRTML